MTDISACHLALGQGWVAIHINQLMGSAALLIAALAFALWPIVSDHVERNGPPGPGNMR